MTWDTYLMVDWSGGNDRGAQPKADAIWAGVVQDGTAQEPIYFRNRQVFTSWVFDFLDAALAADRKVMVGFDFPFGYPVGFGRHVTGSDDPFVLWEWFADRVEDSPKANNRFDIAGQINGTLPGMGPYWGNGLKRDIAHLPRKGLARDPNPFPERREIETLAKGSFTCWQLAGAGSVGSQIIMGLPVLHKLRMAFAGQIAIWPFEPLTKPIACMEIWPTLFAGPAPDGMIKDAHQVIATAKALHARQLTPDHADVAISAPVEGWILGIGQPKLDPMGLIPPPLRNDCFAMPQGAYWTPVDTALAHLQANLQAATGVESVSVGDGLGRVLAGPAIALRAHPPAANAAVDGYALKGPIAKGAHEVPLCDGRAAAGVPFDGTVPDGHALRILTGADIPAGTDTVILQEDITTNGAAIAFHGPLKKGANARAAGEDMKKGEVVFPGKHQVTLRDIATLAAVGVGKINVRKQLRVGVLSTGDEIVAPGKIARRGQIYDANRPMLLGAIRSWGHAAVDLGIAPDDRDTIRDMLDAAAQECDVILTSGGASAGEEDHVSALLENTGSFALWRIAMKPGRPLALGLWNKKPVFGLPGNPVAACVCALIFARPALSVMAGGHWLTPLGYTLPAAFSKAKKQGRREYLRARLTPEGTVEVFPSEGSGRVSSLSWATGLVELPDEAIHVSEGTPVRFLPFDAFGF